MRKYSQWRAARAGLLVAIPPRVAGRLELARAVERERGGPVGRLWAALRQLADDVSPPGGGDAGPSAALTIARAADLQRSQFAIAVAAVCQLLVALLLQVVAHKTALHWLATAALVLSTGVCAWLHTHQAAFGRGTHVAQLLVGVWIVAVSLLVLAYVGPFTAGAIVLSPMCFVFGAARPAAKGWAVLGAATLGFLLITCLALGGVLDPSAGPIGIAARSANTAVLGLAAVTEIVMVASFLVARRGRELVERCFDQIREAREALDRRDHELEQARWDLDRVIEVAQVGRLTGTRMGPYRIGELIGRGGMGEVYRAWRAHGERPVALKVLTPQMCDNPTIVERFFREARVSSSLRSPHIVRVLDSGWAEDGYPFLAMELLRGRDLAVHLEELGRMDPDEVVELVAQVATALGEAHAVGIVHRDIKPENLFCARAEGRPRWVVLDFGVATVKGGTGTLTQGGLIGTPRYMAPEQARGFGVDPRADVFALGAIAYRCLTGHAAFGAEDPLAALIQVLGEQPPKPGAWVALHEDLELVLALALAKEPSQRLGSVALFAQALADARRGELAEWLRRDARALLAAAPWTAPRDDGDEATLRPGAWQLDDSDPRAHTSLLPSDRGAGDFVPPPPFFESEESVTALAAS